MTAQWIEEVAVTCRTSGTDYLDLIIDQAGLDFSVIPALNALSVEWQSLYHGLPEAFIVDDAPLVARTRLDDFQQLQWLKDMSQQVAVQAPLLLLCSHWPFSALAGSPSVWMFCRKDGAGFYGFTIRGFFLFFLRMFSVRSSKRLYCDLCCSGHGRIWMVMPEV
jgi:hypothetical protein